MTSQGTVHLESPDTPHLTPRHPAVVMDDVTLRLGGRVVLDRVTLEIPAHTITGLLGRNGAGKTTLMRTIAGLEPGHEGRAVVAGIPVERLGLRDGAVHLTQHRRRLDPFATWATRVQRVRDRHEGFDADRAIEICSRFGVNPTRHRWRPSLGQSSVMLTALALASRAEVTLLDEPQLGLDAPSRRVLAEIIAEEQSAHPRTVLLSSHVVDECHGLFERLLVLQRGRVAIHDDVDEVGAGLVSVHGPREALAQLPPRVVLTQHALGRRAEAVVDRRGLPRLPQGLTERPLSPSELTMVLVESTTGDGGQR